MIHCWIDLKETYGLMGGKLECICTDYPWDAPNVPWRRPAVIIVPGGGYAMTSRREAEPIANAFLARGYQTFILWYLCAPQGAAYPEQLLELGCAVDYVKKHANEYSVNEKEVFAVGFSAGGHLTANLAVESGVVFQTLQREIDAKPTAVGLSYPVITAKEKYQGTHKNLLHSYPQAEQEELLEKLNLDEAVSPQTAPCFIWTTAEDALVPAENSMRFALALSKNRVAYELHIYPFGAHGGATGDFEINPYNELTARNRRWIDDCNAFFRYFVEEKF